VDETITERAPDAPVIIEVMVRAETLIGPVEDRSDWMILSVGLGGVFALPGPLVTLNGDDVAQHCFGYRAQLLGESFLEGALTTPEGDPDADVSPMGEMGSATWRRQCERRLPSVRFAQELQVCYRGASFRTEFRHMLNHTGGVWLYFWLQEKTPVDPKKPNPLEWASFLPRYEGKAWIDCRSFIQPGTRMLTDHVLLRSATPTISDGTLEDSQTYARIRIELSVPCVPLQDLQYEGSVDDILPSTIHPKFPIAESATGHYEEAVQRTVAAIVKSSPGPVGGVDGVIKNMHADGSFVDTKRELSDAVLQVFRECVRKHTGVTPQQQLTASDREQLFSDTYMCLKTLMAHVVEGMTSELAKPSECLAGGQSDETTSAGPRDVECGVGGSEAICPIVCVLDEASQACRTRNKLHQANESDRCARLALEAEVGLKWDRAAAFWQSRLVLPATRPEPKVWFDYAKFCMRAGRQEAAEEALREAKTLLSDRAHPPSVKGMIDVMLASVLLDRGRHEEAMVLLRSQRDLADPAHNILMALAIYLSGGVSEWQTLVQAAGMRREWFEGLHDDHAVARKLKATLEKPTPEPYVYAFQLILDFGLPNLVFTCIDQCEIPQEILDFEQMVLIDAQASALNRDFTAAVVRLEPLLKSGTASRDAWRVAGSSHVVLGDLDLAMQELQNALDSNDPVSFIRVGQVYLHKKRWRQARDAFLRSVQLYPTAEAWMGVGMAEYRSEAFLLCYEALCEANLLDNSRSDVWCLLCLAHLHLENWTLANQSFRQCMECEPEDAQVLAEIAALYIERDRDHALAEIAARRSLQIKESAEARVSLARALEAVLAGAGDDAQQ